MEIEFDGARYIAVPDDPGIESPCGPKSGACVLRGQCGDGKLPRDKRCPKRHHWIEVVA